MGRLVHTARAPPHPTTPCSCLEAACRLQIDMSETVAGPSKPLPSLIVVNNIKRELDKARDEGLLPAVEDKRARTCKFLRK